MDRRAIIFLTVFSFACSDQNLTDKVPHASEPESTSATLTAAEGGTLTLADGAELRIPAESLSRDAAVVFERTACEPVHFARDFGSCPYTFSTEATLEGRVEISLPSDSNASCVMTETELGWRCLGDSQIEASMARASTSRVARFALRTPDERYRDQTCADMPLEHCGGDIIGTWKLIKSCGTLEQTTGIAFSGPSPYASCPDGEHQRSYPFSVNETLSFFDGPIDPDSPGDAYSREFGAEVWKHEVVTESCLASIGESCHQDCRKVAGVCDCVWPKTSGGGSNSSSYTIDENGNLYFEGSPNPIRYCIHGDQLTMEFPSRDGHESKLGSHTRVYQRE